MNIADNSWIKLPRNFVNWSWYHDANMVQLYLYLLLNANVYDVKYNDITIKRGECLVSLNHLSRETGISQKSLRTGLARLQRTKEIEYKKLKHGRIIILVDFNKFQPIGIDETAPDWIKLYRKICDWGWYHEPNMVHLYVYFMLKAKLTICNDGRREAWQLCSTLRLLTKATGISERSIRTCLSRLQKTGEIEYLPGVSHKQSIITICNYDSYQKNNLSDGTIVAQDGHNLIENKNNTKETIIATQNKAIANSYIASSYNANNLSDGTIVAQEGQKLGTIVAQDGQKVGSTWATLKEYKNKRIEERKNSSTSSACAREGDFVEVLEVSEVEKENEQKKVQKESFYDSLKNNNLWQQAIAKKFHFTTTAQVCDKIEEFELDLICRGRAEHKSLQDCMEHFNDWLEINLRTSKKNNSRSSSRPTTNERWSGEKFVPKSSEGGIYEGNC